MGEQAAVVQFEDDISIDTSKRVQTFAHLMKTNHIFGVTQLIPAFNNLTVCYDPIKIDYASLLSNLEELALKEHDHIDFESKTIHVPVAFGGEYGPDLAEISEKTGMDTDEIIMNLQEKSYYVYMIGFIAGYPYCGDIDKRLNLPRRPNPRQKVVKGSIQIVNHLTGIFTMTAPSGWHIVGWTPMEIFNPHTEPPSIIQAGDSIQYVSISAKEAQQWNEIKQREWNEKWNM